MIEIKIPDFARNRTRAAELEGRNSTDHATAKELNLLIASSVKLIMCFKELIYKENV